MVLEKTEEIENKWKIKGNKKDITICLF
jgi:hypothetical protein